MELQFFAFVVLLAGVACCFLPPKYSLWAMLCFSVFWGSSALTLPSLGGSSVSPASFFLPFYFGRLLLLPGSVSALFDELSPRRPMFWLMLLTVWCVISAMFFPSFFEREFKVFSLARISDNPEMTALRPTSGNISQAVYAIGGFITAWATCAYCRMKGAYRSAFQAIILMAAVNIFGALLDIGTSITGTSSLMDVFRSGTYTLHNEAEVANLKRIVGWMPEASIFCYLSLQVLAATFTLYLLKIHPAITGALSLVLLVLIAGSASTTGFFGLAVLVLAFAAYSLWGVFQGQFRALAIFCVGAFIAICGALAISILAPKIGSQLEQVITEIVLKKSTSDSALERGDWNSTAWNVFLETHGIGAGLGSTRGSSYILVLLSNVGIVGFVLFCCAFFTSLLQSFSPSLVPKERAVIYAGRAAIGMTVVVGAAMWNVYDLGASFYCFLGLCASASSKRYVWLPATSSSTKIIHAGPLSVASVLNAEAV